MATKKVNDSTGPTREVIMAQLRDFALSLPGAFEDFPWDEPVAKVNKKIFVFLGANPGEQRVSFGVKLPESIDEALTFPDSARMGYGLGKHNWVGVYFPAASCPVDLCLDWIEESYRVIAPKTLVKQLDADRPGNDSTVDRATRVLQEKIRPSGFHPSSSGSSTESCVKRWWAA